jgi:autotransporter-associated beta strand protein
MQHQENPIVAPPAASATRADGARLQSARRGAPTFLAFAAGRALARAIGLLLAAVSLAAVSRGDETTWNRTPSAPGTDWHNAGYWSGGVPTSNSLATLPGLTTAPNATCQPTLSNNAVEAIGGLYVHGQWSTSAGWQILNADPNNPATLVLGAMGITNRYRWGGGTCAIQPNIELAANQTWCIDPDYNDNGPLLTGNIGGTGAWTRTGGVGATLYQRRASPTFSGGLTVLRGGVQWNQTGLATADAGAYTFGGGAITLNGGGFIWNCTALSGNNGFGMTLANPINVGPSGGNLFYGQNGGSGYYPNCIFSGPIALGGVLNIESSTGKNGSMPLYNGAVTLSQAGGAAGGFSKTWTLTSNAEGFDPLCVNGVIGDGAGWARNPLILQSAQNELRLAGLNNSYANGTVVSGGGNSSQGAFLNALVGVAPTSSLGRGSARIAPGGRLRLNSSANLAAGATVTVERTGCTLGVLALGANWLPAVSADSEGVLAISSAAGDFTALNNLATLGNGRMFLGADRSGGVFAGATLAPGAGNLYRLGGGNSGGDTLTVKNGVLTGDAGVQVGEPAWWGNGIVRLKGANTFSGDLTVRGIMTMVNAGGSGMGATLAGDAQTAADASPFGATNGAVKLEGGTLRLYGVSGGRPAAKGALTFSGGSRLMVDANSANATALSFDSLTRADRGMLRIDPVRGLLGDTERLLIRNQADSAFLPPSIFYHSSMTGVTGPDFCWYDAAGGTGVRRFTAYNTDLTTSTADDVVKWSGALSSGNHYYAKALNVSGSITGGGTLHLGDGSQAGLLMGGNLSDTATTLDFGTAEGIIVAPAKYTINAKVSGSGGLTVFGQMGYDVKLQLLNTANDFSGTVTIQSGLLEAAFDTSASVAGSLGNLNNGIRLNGGVLTRNGGGTQLAATRTLTLGPCGGWVNCSWSAFSILGRITGPGALFFGYPGGALIIGGVGNDYAGGTWLSYSSPGANTVLNGSTLGTGPVTVGPFCALAVQGDNGICATARVSVTANSTLYFQSQAPEIGSLVDAGKVVLGSAANGCTLKLGGDGTSFNYYGNISEVSSVKPGGVVKVGGGTFTMYGGHTYSGPTIASNGTLRLMGSVAGGLVVAPGATLAGSGAVGGSLTNSGTLQIALTSPASCDCITVAGNVNIAGATLALTGGYTLAVDAQVPIIQAGSVSGGTFANVPDGYIVTASGGSLILRRSSGTTIIVR